MAPEYLSKIAFSLAEALPLARAEFRAEWAIQFAIAFLYPRIRSYFGGTEDPCWGGDVISETICRNHEAWVLTARVGDRDARDMLSDLAEALKAEGKSLPQWLGEYLTEYAVCAMRNGGEPRRKRGRPRCSVRRNMCIVLAIELLNKHGSYNPTRNPEKKAPGESSCSIVQKALQHLGVPMSEANVAAIWQDAVERGHTSSQ